MRDVKLTKNCFLLFCPCLIKNIFIIEGYIYSPSDLGHVGGLPPAPTAVKLLFWIGDGSAFNDYVKGKVFLEPFSVVHTIKLL